MKSLVRLSVLFFATLSTFSASAESAKVSKDGQTEYLRIVSEDDKVMAVKVGSGDGAITIQRAMTSCAKNKGWLQPLIPVVGSHPVTELEILASLNDKDSMLVDMRQQDHFVEGTIPTAINIPYTEVALRLNELGCEKTSGAWNCTNAKKVYAFCNGPVCPQSPIAMKAMVRDGFPADKIYYYRGGMLDWEALGFTTVEGEF
ncbi:MAG: rhodanese-like domain-containing protein [Pseudomonadota bacterium]|nr:rhodanese-like domain-containing protein [Pseudomonadota bacterium]